MFSLQSLRGRYAAAAVLLVAVMVTGVVAAERYVRALRTETTGHIEIRDRMFEYSRHARDAAWQARQWLSAFLLDPHKQEYGAPIQAEIAEAKAELVALRGMAEQTIPDYVGVIDQARHTLDALDQSLQHLIATRLNALEQYPSMALAQNVLEPLNREFVSSVAVVLDDLERNMNRPESPPLYQAFVYVRHLWTQLISNFRIYLANRMGSFREDTLATQERDIRELYDQIHRTLSRIHEVTHGSLQAEYSLDLMQATAENWIVVFQKVIDLHATDAWRSDAKQMKETVDPLFQDLWATLVALDDAIETSSAVDLEQLGHASQAQSRIFWLVTALCVLFVAGGFLALERTVLHPLARLATALNAEARGTTQTPLPKVHSIETRGLIAAFEDMRREVHARQRALEHQARHDVLTQLPNRATLIQNIQTAIDAAQHSGTGFALLMIDLDRFKDVNDTLGHDIGDRLLVAIAQRLRSHAGERDTLARFGGDEFCLMLDGANEERARDVANAIVRALDQIIEIDGHPLLVGACVGISLYPQHGITPQMLVQHADVATHEAKRAHATVVTYRADYDMNSARRLSLVRDLRLAIESGSLELYFQPKIAIATGRLDGVEALVRWTHPEHGRLPPDQFIPLAEHTGLIHPLTRRVLADALTQCALWKANGLSIPVAVNLSASCIHDPSLADFVREQLAAHELAPGDLVLEVTESAMMSDADKAIDLLNRLAVQGIGIAIDDFGTGFSSLAYLKKMPISDLKIDKSFVIDMLNSENDAVIVRSTIELAHNLGLRIVAEGVETQDALDALRRLRCDYAQGYLISRPVPAPELERWYQDRFGAPGNLPGLAANSQRSNVA